MLFSYDLVNAVELALLFKWSLNKTIYDNKQFLIEDIYKNPFVVYYIQEYILPQYPPNHHLFFLLLFRLFLNDNLIF